MIYVDTRTQEKYLFNLIDTPGHVDFSYQVSRSIRACEGAILVVDCTKGIQAQTVSNFYKAFEANLKIVPVINKIDAQAADILATEEQLCDQLDFDLDELIHISAKTGLGVHKVFAAIVDLIPPPTIPKDDVLKCFLFDARFVPTRGVACLVKVM